MNHDEEKLAKAKYDAETLLSAHDEIWTNPKHLTVEDLEFMRAMSGWKPITETGDYDPNASKKGHTHVSDEEAAKTYATPAPKNYPDYVDETTRDAFLAGCAHARKDTEHLIREARANAFEAAANSIFGSPLNEQRLREWATSIRDGLE